MRGSSDCGPGGGCCEAAARPNVIVVNTGKSAPICALQNDENIHLMVITEARFRGLYNHSTIIEEVEDVANFFEVAAAAHTLSSKFGLPRCIVPLSERSIASAAYARLVFALPGMSVNTAMSFTDKYIMKTRLHRAGVSVAPYGLASCARDVAHVACKVGWPVIVKPAYGGGAAAISVFESEEALADPNTPAHRVLETLHRPVTTSDKRFPVVVEKYLSPRGELHCDGITIDGAVRFAAVSRYSGPVLATVGSVSASVNIEEDQPPAPEIRALHELAVAALGLESGVTHMEVLETDGGLIVGEIACRPGGVGIPELLLLRYGIDLWSEYINLGLGRATVPPSDRVEPPQYFGVCYLPVTAGEVARVTSPETLAAIPGVIDVDMVVTPGSTVSEPIDSASISGLVYVRASASSEVDALVDAVENSFCLEMA
jgi:biotin carboxylase